jgi:hypothetical protein
MNKQSEKNKIVDQEWQDNFRRRTKNRGELNKPTRNKKQKSRTFIELLKNILKYRHYIYEIKE